MPVGTPDWSRLVRPEKPFVGRGQTVKVYFTATRVSAGSNQTVRMFTVGAGKKLALSSGVISVEHSCIQRVDYMPMGVTTMVMVFDMNYQLIDSDIGTAIFGEGQYLDLKIYNNDTSDRTFYITLWGQEEDV